MKHPKFVIKQDLHGAIGSDTFEYAAGEVAPKNADERRVLDHLVAAGMAEPKKKG